MFTILKTKHIELDILYRPRVISFSFDCGNNSKIKGKWSNLFLEISILFWTFGFEINWENK